MSKKATLTQRVLSSSAAVLLLVPALQVPAFAATAPDLAGGTRIETAIKIAEASWSNAWKGSKTAVLAEQTHLVDALTVAPLAYKLQAPILLTEATKVSDATLAELKAQGVTTVYIANGTGVIPAAVEAQLKDAGVTTIVRLGGSDRYETAKNIAAKLGTTTKVAVVNGSSIADALSVAAVAAHDGMQIVLSGKDALPAGVDLTGKTVYAVGGSGVLSDSLVSSLKATRLGGDNRYATNAAVLSGLDASLKYDTVYVANGANNHLVDALTGSVLAAQTQSPVVLSNENLTSPEIADTAELLAAKVTDKTAVVAFGGSVAQTTIDAIKALPTVTTDFKVDSVSAVGAKKLQVKFNSAVADTKKAAISVKKGTVAVNVDSVEFSADKTSATITTSSNLTKGEYTVTVSGLTTTALTGKVTAEDQKVAKINLKSAKAPRLAGNDKKALVSYAVLNQYGEDITSSNPVSWTISTGVAPTNVSQADGTFEITAAAAADFIPGATVYITGVHAASGTVVNGQVEIALASQADAVTFKGVYDLHNSKLVDLPAGFDNNRYVLLFQVTDQYGNTMKNPDDTKLVFTSNNPLYVDSTSFTAHADVVIDDTTYEAVNLVPGTSASNGGSVTIQAISTVTGKTSIYAVKADALAAVKTFTMSAPDAIVTEGKDVEVPFTAVDQYGKAVTDYDKLNANVTLSPGYNAGVGLRFEKQDDGSAKLKYYAPATGATADVDLPVYVTSVVKDGGNFSSLMLSVRETAVPAAIVGVDTGDISTNIAKTNTEDIVYSNLVVQDQYGRTMSDDDFKAWLDVAANKVVVTSDIPAAPAADTTAFTVKLNGGADADTQVMDVNGDKITLGAANQSAASENITFKLQDASGVIDSSAKTFTFTNVKQTAYVSFSVDDPGLMYNDSLTTADTNSKWDKTITVYGVEADGTKVKLPATDYTVTTDGKLDVAANVISDTATVANGYAAADFKDVSNNYQDVKVSFLVTVNDTENGTGAALDAISKDLTISNKDPKVAVVNLKNVTDGKATVNPVVAAISATTLHDRVIDSVKDQYGVDFAENAVITITKLVKTDSSALTITNNGTATAAIAGAALGDKFTATFKYASGVTSTVNFTVGLPQ